MNSGDHLHWNGNTYVKMNQSYTDTYNDIPYNPDKITGSIVGLIKYKGLGLGIKSDGSPNEPIFARNPEMNKIILALPELQKPAQFGDPPRWKHIPLSLVPINNWLKDYAYPSTNTPEQTELFNRITSLVTYYAPPDTRRQPSSTTQTQLPPINVQTPPSGISEEVYDRVMQGVSHQADYAAAMAYLQGLSVSQHTNTGNRLSRPTNPLPSSNTALGRFSVTELRLPQIRDRQTQSDPDTRQLQTGHPGIPSGGVWDRFHGGASKRRSIKKRSRAKRRRSAKRRKHSAKRR
jgi:hypothetical protein